MHPSWLLIAQAASASPPSLPSDFDLARLHAPDANLSITGKCEPRSSGEIVVCGRRRGGEDGRSRYKPEFKDRRLAAEIGIGGGATARAYVESVGMPDSQISKRIMIGVKVPF